MRTVVVVVATVVLAGIAAAGVLYLENGSSEPAAGLDDAEIAEALDAPPSNSTCIIRQGDVVIDRPLHQAGNVIIISQEGDIRVDASIQTEAGEDGHTPRIYPPEDSIPHYYSIGHSGRDAGDIVLLAPNGDIHLNQELRPGRGGDGLGVEVRFEDLDDKRTVIDQVGHQHVYLYGGYGGFGGDIFLGARAVHGSQGNLYPGEGGTGGDVVLEGANIHDTARAGHGGMGGQAYLLDHPFATELTQDAALSITLSDWELPTGIPCEHPITLDPHEPLPAQVLQPSHPTCRGGDGGNATTTGLYGSSTKYGWDDTIAGVAVGGNGGWGCPGGEGGDALTLGAVGDDGPPIQDAACSPNSVEGPHGLPGRPGGFGGHAFGGDGGAGAPGQALETADAPTPLYWFFSWGTAKSVEYDSDPSWPIRWGTEDGRMSEFTVDFPLIGDDTWYRGGDGGAAMSIGGDGGDGGRGGDGSSGPTPGPGGAGGVGGRGATHGVSKGGWGGPGAFSEGFPGGFTANVGRDGLPGDPGDPGERRLLC